MSAAWAEHLIGLPRPSTYLSGSTNPEVYMKFPTRPSSTSPLFLSLLLILPLAVHAQPAPPVVDLGTAANYTVLAGSAITSIAPSVITGDVGLSPATGANISGLTQAQVVGTIYAVNDSGPVGSVSDAGRLTTAQGDLTIAYNNAAARTPVPTGPFLNPGSANIGTLTLVPGLYKFTSTLLISGGNVTLSGGANEVWIFQIGTSLTLANNMQVILTGGAKAANVFWQVGSSAALGTNSVMKGTIMADQSITMGTGGTLEGRALARIAAVTLASNAVTRPDLAVSIAGGTRKKSMQPFTLTQSGRYLNATFSIPVSARTTLKLFNSTGSQVATLFDAQTEAGVPNRVHFNADRLPRGLYFSKFESGGNTRLQRVLLGQ
jgi:hypothetical protein